MTRQSKQAHRKPTTKARTCGHHSHNEQGAVFCTLAASHRIRCRSVSQLSGSTVLGDLCDDPDCKYNQHPKD